VHSGLIPSQEELQACRSNAHFGHCATGSMTFCSSVPHFRTAGEAGVPGMLIDDGPDVFSFLAIAGFSNSSFGPPPESYYPRCASHT
jgi:hypothetical protein